MRRQFDINIVLGIHTRLWAVWAGGAGPGVRAARRGGRGVAIAAAARPWGVDLAVDPCPVDTKTLFNPKYNQ